MSRWRPHTVYVPPSSFKAETIFLVFIAAIIGFFFFYPGAITGLSVINLNINTLAPGQPLKGTVSYAPSERALPLDSEITVSLNGFSKKKTATEVIDSDYVKKYETAIQFGPGIMVELEFPASSSEITQAGGSGGSSAVGEQGTEVAPVPGGISHGGVSGRVVEGGGIPAAEQGTEVAPVPGGISPVISVDSSGIEHLRVVVWYGKEQKITLPSEARVSIVRAQLLRNGNPVDSASVYTRQDKTELVVGTNYYEFVKGIPSSAPAFSIDLSLYGFVPRQRGTVTAVVSYQGESLASTSESFNSLITTQPNFLLPFRFTSLKDVHDDNFKVGESITEKMLNSGCTSYSCAPPSECSTPAPADLAKQRELTVPVQTSFCTFNCGESFVRYEKCEARTPISIVSLSGTGPLAQRVGSRAVTIINKERDEPAAYLRVREDKRSLDLVVVQSREQANLACYNALQDEGEEGVDCGGLCSPCRQEKREFLASMLWLVVIALVGTALVVMRKHVH